MTTEQSGDNRLNGTREGQNLLLSARSTDGKTMIGEEAWRLIPPEEKFLAVAKSHAVGIQWAICLTLVGGTMAVSFQTPALFWGSLIASPIIFQFASSRSWRTLRPALLLQFLAARSVSRRFAYAIKATDLQHSLLFRATMTHQPEEVAEGSGLEKPQSPYPPVSVWVALFSDSVVLISEQEGGASLEFGHLINKRFNLQVITEDDRDYSQEMSLFMEYDDINYGKHRVKLESRFPASLNVFAKQVQHIINNPQADFEGDAFSADIRETEDALHTAAA